MSKIEERHMWNEEALWRWSQHFTVVIFIIGVLIFIFANSGSDNNQPQLEQFDREKVTISSGNGFDLQ